MALQTAEAPVRYHQRLKYYICKEEVDNLPKDPRQWTREHVAEWLETVSCENGLPPVAPSRFLMNGKGLCLMTPGMFLTRVPIGGKLLYKDFQLRLSVALHSQ